MKKRPVTTPKQKRAPFYERIRQILESARSSVARSVNTTQVVANWLVGREIVEEEQGGRKRARYGERLLAELSQKLTAEFGRGYSLHSLKFLRQFYAEYPELLKSVQIGYAVRSQLSSSSESTSGWIGYVTRSQSMPNESAQELVKGHALRDLLDTTALIAGGPNAGRSRHSPSAKQPIHHTPRDTSEAVRGGSGGDTPGQPAISNAPRSESWQPGGLHPNLSWTHYRTLLRVDRSEARAFYEIESLKNNWSARELERQINSLLYERLAKSRDKAGLMRLATRGLEIAKPADIFKDPVVIEFLGVPESPRLVETRLEKALINNLQAFTS